MFLSLVMGLDPLKRSDPGCRVHEAMSARANVWRRKRFHYSQWVIRMISAHSCARFRAVFLASCCVWLLGCNLPIEGWAADDTAMTTAEKVSPPARSEVISGPAAFFDGALRALDRQADDSHLHLKRLLTGIPHLVPDLYRTLVTL